MDSVSSVEDEVVSTKYVLLRNQSDFVAYCEQHAASEYKDPPEYPVIVYQDTDCYDEVVLSYFTVEQLEYMLKWLKEK